MPRMPRAVLLALCCLIAPAAQAQMYKCVDERGVTHYSDKPRPGCKGGKVDIQPSPPIGSGEPRSSGEGRAPAGDLKRQDAELRNRQAAREAAEAKEKSALAERCARLREEHAKLASGIRIARRDPQGERVYMDDATRDARLAQVREEMRNCP